MNCEMIDRVEPATQIIFANYGGAGPEDSLIGSATDAGNLLSASNAGASSGAARDTTHNAIAIGALVRRAVVVALDGADHRPTTLPYAHLPMPGKHSEAAFADIVRSDADNAVAAFGEADGTLSDPANFRGNGIQGPSQRALAVGVLPDHEVTAQHAVTVTTAVVAADFPLFKQGIGG